MVTVRYVGFFNEVSGFGQAARNHLTCMAQSGISVVPDAVGLTAYGPRKLTPDTLRYPELRDVEDCDSPCDIDIIHTLAPDMHHFIRPGRYTIGITAWETEIVPSQWIERLSGIDELWVPSSFTAAAFKDVLRRPIRIMPHPVSSRPFERQSFPGIPDHTFVFLAILEWQDRKNPEGLLRAVNTAFRGRWNVCLVLKIGTLFYHHQAEIDRILRQHTTSWWPTPGPKVWVIQEPLSPRTMERLYRRADAFVSLHRAEGFGLCLAEAMATRRPVIATAYSGNMDFMDDDSAFLVPYNLVPAEERRSPLPIHAPMRWAEPLHDAAVDALRSCVANNYRRAKIAYRGFEKADALLSPLRVGRLMATRLRQIAVDIHRSGVPDDRRHV